MSMAPQAIVSGGDGCVPIGILDPLSEGELRHHRVDEGLGALKDVRQALWPAQRLGGLEVVADVHVAAGC